MAPDGGPGLEPREIEDRLLEFIRRELLSPGIDVGRRDDLLSGELLDSVAVLRLAAFVEEAFEIKVQPADFVIENFANVVVLAEYVGEAGRRAG